MGRFTSASLIFPPLALQVLGTLCRYLLGLEPRRDPGVLLGGAARVVIGDGVSLEV